MANVDRRTFLARSGGVVAATGAAWIAPSVIGSSTAWAGGTCPAPFINSFPATNAATNSSDWTRTITAGTFESGNPFLGTNGYLGIRDAPGYNGISPAFLSENDPTALGGGGVATLTYATTFAATAGQTYRFTFKTYCYTDNAGTQSFALVVGGATIFRGDTNGGGTGVASMTHSLQTWNVDFVCTSTNAATPFVYQFSLNTVRGSSPAKPSDDIGVSAPSVTCSFT